MNATATGSWQDEIVHLYPRRDAVPQPVWRDLFARAERQIDVLVYAGAFITQDDELMRILAERAAAGVRVRILLGDPDAAAVTLRGDDEGIDGVMSAMAREALAAHRASLEPRGAQVRLHDTTLYASVYRADDEMLVNTHVYGISAGDAPVTHLRRGDGEGLFATYQRSLDRVWDGARPVR
jgi:hypothetical protein